jgi:hypothetical protein
LLRGRKKAEVKVNHICVQEVFKFESDLMPCELGKVRTPPNKEIQEGEYMF